MIARLLARRMPPRSDEAWRYDTDQPWIVWCFLTADRMSRVLGRSIVHIECAVCGEVELLSLRLPRFRPRPGAGSREAGKHVERLRFLLAHLHPDKGHPFSWARPLLNPAAHKGGIDLRLLAMRLEADLNAAVEEEAAS